MRLTFFILIFILFVSLIGNFFLFFRNPSSGIANIADLKKQYPLIAQRALLRQNSNTSNDLITNILPLRTEIHKIIDPYKDSFALYFEYLPTGTSIGINEDSEFTPASLLKVPVVMAYYYKKERLGLIMAPMVTLTPSELNTRFGDFYKKGAGQSVSLDEAAKLAIEKSDNTASLVLADYISDDDYRYVQEGLDIPLDLKGKAPIITAQQYSSILKALYISSILNKDDSQEILDLLSHTDFHDMLPSGIPDGVTVAHKIGLIDEQIYNDCGIVYVPRRPYLLCMISQSDSTTAKSRMKMVSKTIYDYVAGYR